jgi:hypothetical protein
MKTHGTSDRDCLTGGEIVGGAPELTVNREPSVLSDVVPGHRGLRAD